jgi:hypothetical protein
LFELASSQREELRQFLPKGGDWTSFCNVIEQTLWEHPPARALAPTRRQQALMAAHFEKFGKAVAGDPYAAVFVATRVKIGLTLEAARSLELLARQHRLMADNPQPNPLVDGFGDLKKKTASNPGDPNGNDLIRALADLVEAYGSEAKGESFVGLVRWCWKASGRTLPNTEGAFFKRIGRAISERET